MSWLTEDVVKMDAQALIHRLEDQIRRKANTYVSTGDSPAVLQVLQGRAVASSAIRRDWFFASMGVIDILDDTTEETYYLSKASNAYYFCELNVVPWTNWLGSLYVHLKESVKRGRFPAQQEYGPPKYLKARPIGPLVDYTLVDGLLKDFAFHSAQAPRPAPRPLEALEVRPPEKPQFGLKEIIRSIDIAQDNRIRGPMEGIFILIGGPGVGKTTVALHRIPYLINEHAPPDHPRMYRPDQQAERFFTQKTTLVVVWKEHLVSYLQNCLNQLELGEVKAIHVEDWIASHLRSYVPMGVGANQYRVTDEEEDITEAKLRLGEKLIGDFVRSTHPLCQQSYNRVADVVDRIHDSLDGTGLRFGYILRADGYTWTVPGVLTTIEQLRAALAHVEEAIKDSERIPTNTSERRQSLAKAKKGLSKARSDLSDLRAAELKRIGSSYTLLLERFYTSNAVLTHLTEWFDAHFTERFMGHVQDQARSRVLSKVDRYLLLWLIHFVTRKSPSEDKKCAPLPEYSHVLIDEAQYYHPIVLRLFANLTREPNKSMTIVGDLEQRITAKGGIIAWEAMGLEVPVQNIQRLVTNYRWSKKVFEFLAMYKTKAGLAVTLQEPYEWPSGDGVQPDVARFPTRDLESDWLVRRIIDVRSGVNSSQWTIAVILPPSLAAENYKMIAEMRSCDIKARWASGEDVKESTEQVVLTDYESIVGLEFDAVFVAGCDEVLKDEVAKEVLQSVWVAITRARQYIAVSYAGQGGLFDGREFDKYRAAQ
jgi:hypothetical protein